MKKYKFMYVKLGDTWDPWEKDGRSNDGGFCLDWGAEDIGFGQLTFYKKDGKTICLTECMSEEFVKQAIDYFANSIKLEHI